MSIDEAVAVARANRHRGDEGWCVCPGDDGGPCCGAATGDDGMCDRCRTHCKADHAEATTAAEPETAAA